MKKTPKKPKKPKKQNPYFSYATEHPSGKPLALPEPDSTLSRAIEIGADGPPKTLLQITGTHNGTLRVLSPANAEYNESGRFFMLVQGLIDGVHTFGLRANSSSSPFDQWLLTVRMESTSPTITSVTTSPGNVEIPHNGETIATQINVIGEAAIKQPVEILVNGQSRGTLTTEEDGSFSLRVSGFDFDARTDLQVFALYGSHPPSEIRSFFAYRPLQINQSDMILNGYVVYTGWPRTGLDFLNNTEFRLAIHGVPPVIYSSSNPAVASVDANRKVTGNRNGMAVITVQDKFSSLNFTVYVSNVFTLDIYPVASSYDQAIYWMTSIPGSIQLTDAIPAMQRVYGSDYYWPLTEGSIYSMCDYRGCQPYFGAIYKWRQGGYVCHSIFEFNFWAWCLRPY